MVVSFRTQNNSFGKVSVVVVADAIVLILTVLAGSLIHLASGESISLVANTVLLGSRSSVLALLVGRHWRLYQQPERHLLATLLVLGASLLVASGLVYPWELLRGAPRLDLLMPGSLFVLLSSVLLLVRFAPRPTNAQLTVPLHPHPLARKSNDALAPAREHTQPTFGSSFDDQIRQAVQGRRVMIFGADTSEGRAFCQFVVGYAPESLVLQGQHEQQVADTYEAVLAQLRPDQKARIFAGTADLRMAERLEVLVQNYRPELVIYAGIPASTPISAADPIELVARIVLGTRYLLRAVTHAGAARTIVVVPAAQATPQPLLAACQQLVILQALGSCQLPERLVMPVQQSSAYGVVAHAAKPEAYAQQVLAAALSSPPYTLALLPASPQSTASVTWVPIRQVAQLEQHLDHLAQSVYHGNSEEVVRHLLQLVPNSPLERAVGQAVEDSATTVPAVQRGTAR